MNVLTGFHPGFDALSSFADQSDLDAVRTRVGRHVARCESCRATVAEIRALGKAARAVELPAAPAGLWARIEQAGRDAADAPAPRRETPSPETDVFTTAPALRPTRHVPSPLRQGLRGAGIVLAAAGILAAVLLVPLSGRDPLQAASSAGTWHFAPSRPAPGATVTVRYLPAATDPAPPTLNLVGGWARPLGDESGATYDGINRLQDSLTTLTRQPDGSYAGRFTLPTNFTAVVLRLFGSLGGERGNIIMSPEGPLSRRTEAVAILVAGDAHGGPSLAALTSAVDLWTGGGMARYQAGDSLVKYFPDEPMGYAAMRAPRSRRLLDGLLGWFKSGERQYTKFDRRYMAQPTVSAEHAIAMIRLANRIEEPGEARKWTMRLAREHTGDPRALYAYSAMLRGMFQRPNTIDSVRRDLPLTDTLWERNGHRGANEDLVRASSTAEDRVLYHRWTLRAMQEGARNWRADRLRVDLASTDDPAIRRAAEPLLRADLATPCVMPAGKVSLWEDRDSWMDGCIAGRASDYQGLSRIARLDGDAARALALADSSMALMASTANCWVGGSHVRRGEALLALGRPAEAARELAWAATGGNWQSKAYRDSVAPLLRPAVDSARWDAHIRAASEERSACVAAATRLRQERAERRRAAEGGGVRR